MNSLQTQTVVDQGVRKWHSTVVQFVRYFFARRPKEAKSLQRAEPRLPARQVPHEDQVRSLQRAWNRPLPEVLRSDVLILGLGAYENLRYALSIENFTVHHGRVVGVLFLRNGKVYAVTLDNRYTVPQPFVVIGDAMQLEYLVCFSDHFELVFPLLRPGAAPPNFPPDSVLLGVMHLSRS